MTRIDLDKLEAGLLRDILGKEKVIYRLRVLSYAMMFFWGTTTGVLIGLNLHKYFP